MYIKTNLALYKCVVGEGILTNLFILFNNKNNVVLFFNTPQNLTKEVVSYTLISCFLKSHN